MMAMISPALEAYAESLSTLKFANRAKNIRNAARVNEDVDQRTLLRKYERELRRLRAELQQRQRELVDKRHLLEVEEQKRRAEADKLAAITALEVRSREFMVEKEEKRRLEARITSMQSQLLIGGHKIEDMPVFRTLLAREHKRIRAEYEERVKQLEQERQGVEEERVQVDRYKQLLLKQRDIMIALTGRLNERDEQILTLQEELEAYDAHQKQLEDALDHKNAELIDLRKAALEHAVASPIKPSSHLQSALGAWGNAVDPLARQQEGATSSGAGAGAGLLDQQGFHQTPPSAHSSHGYTSGTAVPSQVLQDQLEQLQHQHDEYRAEALQSMQAKDDLVQQLQQQNEQLIQQSASQGDADLQSTIQQQSSDIASLREQCSNHAKERAALKTILDAKIKALVDDISQSVSDLPPERGPQIKRQVIALNKLVGATVNAMSAAGNQA
ncbi:hypothetical protein ABBQ38_012240 [Trebouxia sp. C0009 RCD-2024]